MAQSAMTVQCGYKSFKTFILESYQECKIYQMQKIVAVAIACLLFFAIQIGCSWTIAFKVSFICSTITLLSEIFLRDHHKQKSNWQTDTDSVKRLMTLTAHHVLGVIASVALVTALGIMPAQAVTIAILSGNMKLIGLVTLVAPFTEEILFRGFIQERLEDVVTLVGRYIHPLPKNAKTYFATSIQSLLFGAIHITGGQIVKKSMRIIVFIQVTLAGLLQTYIKNRYDSLFVPVVTHSAHNTGIVLGLHAGNLLRRIFVR